MNIEYVSAFEVEEDNTLWIIMKSQGGSEFQYVYRAGRGVYWQPEKNGFHFDPKGDVNVVKWFKHMIAVINSELGLEMRSSENLVWKNIPLNLQSDVLRNLTGK